MEEIFNFLKFEQEGCFVAFESSLFDDLVDEADSFMHQQTMVVKCFFDSQIK